MSAPAPDLRDFPGLLVLVGAGKMGGALLEGWLRLGLDPGHVAVIEPNPSAHVAGLGERGVKLNPDMRKLSNVAAVVIAVKPQIAAEVLPAVAPVVGASTLVVSIMAGRKLQSLAGTLKDAGALVRAMPNLPAFIGHGITVAVPLRASKAQRNLVDRLLSATGMVVWVEDEGMLDAVTAVSGSGPAYVFLLAEALAQAGTAAGLPQQLAAQLARETVAGAGALLHESKLDPAALRAAVTSPGGTTAAALEVLSGADGLSHLLNKAVAAATARSRKLAE